MQGKTGNNEQTDRLAGYMKQRLDTHRLPVDEVCWQEIEQRLEASRAFPRLPGWRWAVAAAALFGGLIGLFFLPELRQPAPTAGMFEKNIPVRAREMDNTAAESRLPGKGGEKESGPAGGEKSESAVTVAGVSGSELAFSDERASTGFISPAARLDTTVVGASVSATDSVSTTVSASATASAATSVSAATSASAAVSASAKTKKTVVSGPEEAPGTRRAGIRFEKAAAVSASRGWLLAVAGGAGVGGASFGVVNGLENNIANDSAPGSDYKPLPSPAVPDESFSPEDYPEADYALPLSLGIKVRRNFNDRLAIESGLVYTYLSSRFVASGAVSRKARLELHYLGIPLNLVVYAWNHPRWNVYFTAGGMVEKGLKSLYTQQVYRERELAVLSRSESIGGLQWSLHLSAGAEYRFYRTWSVYLEPSLSRYFDNAQPASYRTAHTWSIGLTGGIRYAF